MEARHSEQLQQWVFPVSIVFALLILAAAFALLGPVVGIKSAYVLLGLLLSSAIYYAYNNTIGTENITRRYVVRWRTFGKAVFAVVALSIAAVPAARRGDIASVAAARVAVLLVGLPAGYALLAVQLRRPSSTLWLLAQIVALFAVSPVTKVQATGFYIGRGDTPKHVQWIDQVVASGTWASIPQSSFYHYFPGLHTLLGSTRILTGVSSYHVYMLVGILTYAVVVCVAYLLARAAFGEDTIALFVALGTSLVTPVLTASTYFYPQALASAVVFVLVLVVVRASGSVIDSPGFALLASLLVAMLVFTHHLTVVLFVPIILTLVSVPMLVERISRPGRSAGSVAAVARPQALPLAAWVIGSVAYWHLRDVFIGPFLWSVRTILADNPVAGGGGSAVPVQTLGATLPDPSMRTAAISLVSPGGIYNVALVCFVALGAVTILGNTRRYRRPVAFLAVGLAGSILLFKTPLVAVGLRRFQLPLSLFVAFVVGVALARLLLIPERPGTQFAPALVVFLLLSTAGPVVTADDAYALHAGPDLWETQPAPEFQKEFTQQELSSLERTAAFVDRRGVTVGSDWHSQIGLRRFGTDSRGMVVADGGLKTTGELLLYRDRWPEHSLRLIPERLSLVTLVISEERQQDLIRTENKVYTTGEVGLLADSDGGGQYKSRSFQYEINSSSQ